MADEDKKHPFDGEEGKVCDECGKPQDDPIHEGRIVAGAGTARGHSKTR